MGTDSEPIRVIQVDADVWPRGVVDPECPDGHLLDDISTDRRLLWHLETLIAVGAPGGGALARAGSRLGRYLRETCEHHWHDYAAEPDFAPAHRQCLWCNDVQFTEPADV